MSYDTSFEEQKNRAISIGNAVNATATLAARTEDPIGYFTEHLDTVIGAVLQAQAFHAITAAFPGTTVVAEAQVPVLAGPIGAGHVQPTQQQAYQPAPQPSFTPPPAAIPGVQSDDTEANWMSFFTAWNAGQVAPSFGAARPGQWFDNRTGKSPTAPDFKVKVGKGENGPALWATGKKNPAWVPTALQQAGL